VIAIVVALQTHSGGSAASGTTATNGAQSERHAAVLVSGLLAQSVTDRANVVNAVVDVNNCGPSLPEDAGIFTRAATSRRHLLARLGKLPGRSSLPRTMLQDLAGAWQTSAQADTDLARWADDEIRGCSRNGGSNPSLRASFVYDGEATADKQAFATAWDAIAKRYGLTTYQWGQL
jgi:hypothetical protein